MFKCIDKSVSVKLEKMKANMTDNDFWEYLAKNSADLLAKILKEESLDENMLAQAAEYMGSSEDSKLVRSTLYPLLSHNSSSVREGALLGLSNHLDSVTKFKVVSMMKNDQSSSVRSVASGLINY